MNSSAFEKVLLSAILTSCAVFSVLMLAFMPRRSEPITINPPDLIPSLEDINQRDVIIRHIGISIMVSVGAGITTAEIFRKWGRSRETVLAGQQVSGAQAMLRAVALPELAVPGDRFAASLNSLTEPDMAIARPGSPDAASVLSFDWDGGSEQSLPLFLFQPPVPLPTEDVNWFLPALTESALLTPSAELSMAAVSQANLPSVLAAREQYQTCRMHLPDAPEPLLAILAEGQYYRFVKVASDREQAFSIADRLAQRGETIVLTQTEKRYAVWTLEPEACPEATR